MSDIGEGIQLHFCQSCGISIPQPDIDSGRARPAPGGYVCAGCVYQARDLDLAAGEQPAVARTSSVGGVLTVIAMLYAVGVATFLLVKEMQRETPKLDLGNVATESRLQQLSRTIDEMDSQARGRLRELKNNDDQLGKTISELGARIGALNQTAADMSSEIETQVQGLRRAILDLTHRTVGVKGGIDEVLRKLNELEERVGQDPGPGIGPIVKQDAQDGQDSGPQPPRGKSRGDLEKERQLAEFIVKLKDRKASDQTRYNAAVQLGDLPHADSVAALQMALEQDPNNLVRRAAAWSLGMLGRLAIPAIPTLVKELGGKEEYVGYMCERALGEITKAATGQPVTFNYDPTMSRKERRKIQKRWEEWWTKNRDSLMPE